MGNFVGYWIVITELIRGLAPIKPSHQHGIVTIGNFDGVHRGHQGLLSAVTEKARREKVPSLAIIFEPQPLEFFLRETPVARLTNLREKFLLLAKTQIQAVIVLRFNATLANLSAEEFVRHVLVDRLKVKEVMVGDDFRFGKKRKGDLFLLKEMGERYHFAVSAVSDQLIEGERVSSTRVRQALRDDNQMDVKKLLGRSYTMQGRVVHGDKRGRVLGFPTANILLHRLLAPIQGVYVVRMSIDGGAFLPGVANIGVRPAIPGTDCLLEVYLFHFDQWIYGSWVCVEFCKKIRDEMYFSTLELLKEKIAEDVIIAESYFNRNKV